MIPGSSSYTASAVRAAVLIFRATTQQKQNTMCWGSACQREACGLVASPRAQWLNASHQYGAGHHVSLCPRRASRCKRAPAALRSQGPHHRQVTALLLGHHGGPTAAMGNALQFGISVRCYAHPGGGTKLKNDGRARAGLDSYVPPLSIVCECGSWRRSRKLWQPTFFVPRLPRRRLGEAGPKRFWLRRWPRSPNGHCHGRFGSMAVKEYSKFTLVISCCCAVVYHTIGHQ